MCRCTSSRKACTCSKQLIINVWLSYIIKVPSFLPSILQIRFVKSDDIWLSPNYHRDSCHLTLFIHNPPKEIRELYFFGLYRALHYYKPRVHWGKEFSITLQELQSVSPKVNEFLTIRKRLDPNGIFLSNQLAKTLGL